MVQSVDVTLVFAKAVQPPGIDERTVGRCRTKWEITYVKNAQKEVTGLSRLRVLLDTVSPGPPLF